MSGASLKISADTSPVKKSILDLSKSIKDLKGSNISIFNASDKAFIKTELKREIGLMKNRIKENREEISKMVKEQKAMVAGTEEELKVREQILKAYQLQAKLAKDLQQTQKAQKGADGGGMMGLGKLGALVATAAAATLLYGVTKAMKANDQYRSGTANRVKLKGLGVEEDSFGSEEGLARVGLTEQDMIQRRIDATSRLGREGSSNESEMQKAGFEKAFGLDGGTMTGIANSLRGSMGGKGANEAQMKLQASVYAAGIEDALAPYLESATSLLQSINENGLSNTEEMTGLLAQLTKDGKRTPEQMAKVFATMNDSVKGATGEQSAFLQTAFARAGIGGGTLGGTKFAMESGGVMGMNRKELEKRGYSKKQLDSMDQSGMFKGASERLGAVSDQIRSSGGMQPGQAFSSVKGDQMYGIGNLASKALGLKGGMQGMDAMMMLDDVKSGKMSKGAFDKKIKEMQEGADPSVDRLNKINATLAGQTKLLEQISENTSETAGKKTIRFGNIATKLDTAGMKGVGTDAEALDNMGVAKAGEGIASGAKGIMNGSIGEFLGGQESYADKLKFKAQTSPEAIINLSKKRRDEGKAFKGWTDEQIETKIRANMAAQSKEIGASMGKEAGKVIAESMGKSPTVNKNTIVLPNGNVTNKTTTGK